MAEQLKNMFSPEFIGRLAADLNRVCGVPEKQFVVLVMDDEWEKRELKQRSRHIAACLHQCISGSYTEQIEKLKEIGQGYRGYTAILFADFVEVYGLENWEVSMKAMETFTQLSSAEFAVRPYFLLDFERMVAQHLKWSLHPNEHVRRLASEGIRPRLPWGTGIPRLKKEPEVIFPILDNLIHDPSEYVRRSVANNLNDVSKDFPEKVLEYVSRLDLSVPNTVKLVKHAVRGLLKKGNKTALVLFGFHDQMEVNCLNLEVDRNTLSIGDNLNWKFDLEVKGEGKLRLEYHVYFQKASGIQTHKVFQLTEQQIQKRGNIRMSRKHAFRDLTTRKHYPGIHRLELVANGISIAGIDFELSS
jgi:3-methyladenine DNA glycosylase AlkC